MNKVIVYPRTNLSTPFYNKKKKEYVVWTPNTKLVVVRASNESVVVKPFGRGCYRELEVAPQLLGISCTSTSHSNHFMSLDTLMPVAEVIGYLKIK